MIEATDIAGLVREAARRHGARDAIVDVAGTLSFSGLADAVAAAAAGLHARGLRAEDRLALWAPNSADWIVACLAAQVLGAAVVPLNTRLKGAEAAHILSRTGARLLVTVGEFLGTDYPALISDHDLPALSGIIRFGSEWRQLVADHAGATLPPSGRPDATADIIFTSGTTGVPKGVMSDAGQNMAAAASWAARVGLREGDRYLLVSPFFHTFGYKAGWLACLIVGATALPMATFDAQALPHLLADQRVTVLAGAPTIFQSLLDTGDGAGRLRVGVTGAASVPPILIERMRRELGIPTVLTGYGLTESTGVVSLTDAGDSAEVAATTAGRPVPGVEVRCVDAAGRSVPQGDQGEVLVRGPNVMRGYLDDPVATTEAIDADGWLHTGDIGLFTADGCLQITDRIKDMYIAGGFNCYPAEIERILATHPDIAAAAVIGVPDARMGEVGKAFVVPRPGVGLVADEVLAWAKSAMANYKAPRFVEVRGALPVNASGKVLKGALRDESGVA